MRNASHKKFEGETLRQHIEKACRGLNFGSEIDADVTPFFFAPDKSPLFGSKGSVMEAINGIQREEPDFEKFFGRLTRIDEWYNAEQTRNAKRFAKLRLLLIENLADLKVLRSGRIRIDIHVYGVDERGNLHGFVTKAVET